MIMLAAIVSVVIKACEKQHLRVWHRTGTINSEFICRQKNACGAEDNMLFVNL